MEDTNEQDPQTFTISCSTSVIGSTLLKQFKELYDQPLFSDLKIELTDGTKLNAHKSVLALWFPTMLNELKAFSKDGTLRFEKADPTIAKLLLKFIYEGTVKIESDQILPLIELADVYELDVVKDKCGEALFERQKDIAFLLDISAKYRIKRLEVLCADHFAENLSTIVKDSPDQLYKLPVLTWEALLKKSKVDAKSERELFEMMMDYVKNKFSTAPERDAAFNKLLPQICFVALQPEYILSLEKDKLIAHLPILSDIIHETFKFRALTPEVRKRVNFKIRTIGRSLNVLCWSPEFKHNSITISEDGLKCTSTSEAIYQSVRTHTGVPIGGSAYFEMTINVKASWMVFGVCDSSFVTSNTVWPTSYNTNTWLYHHNNAAFWHNGQSDGGKGNTPPYIVGSVVGVVIDHVGSRIAFYLDGKLVASEYKTVPSMELFVFVTCHSTTAVTINSPPKYNPL